MIESLQCIAAGAAAAEKCVFTDVNGDMVVIPKGFSVSEKNDEQTINTGLVIIGPDGSEFVWVPTTQTELAIRDFRSYVSWGWNPADYWDETDLPLYQDMVASVGTYGGFYVGRYEASYGSSNNLSDYTSASKRIESADSGRIRVHFSSQDASAYS